MQEEIIISGRNLPNIDPHLHIWHWPIYIDLFMGGLAAGLLFFAALFYLIGKEDEYPVAVKKAPIFAPIAIMIALVCLFIDLKHKLYFWQLYTTFKLQSPMSFGSWVLLFITPISFAWVFTYLRELFPGIKYKFNWLIKLEYWLQNQRKTMAWLLIFLSVSLGIYTGILLSAFNARPLWNSAIFGPLFLTYGLLTGSALIMWLALKKSEIYNFRKLSLILIGITLFFILHLFMGYSGGSEVQLIAAELFIYGQFSVPFWALVVGVGLIIPGILELLSLKYKSIPVFLSATCILIGGFFFRMFIVQGGELIRYLY